MVMTFWATLWYAGAVVLTLGYEGQTLEQCETLTNQMIADVTSAYYDPSININETMFPTNEFAVSCEKEMLPIDEKYRE